MSKTTKKTLKILGGIITGVLAFLGVILIALFIYYYPIIDRLYIRPCYYYPNAFSNCIVK